MTDIINNNTFIQQLTYYLKVGIYINKGTDNEVVLNKCIKMYNKYKMIETEKDMNEENASFVRKCLKRLNLVLKIDENGKPVDVREKDNQLKMIHLKEHPSLQNNNLNEMIKYATENNINILVGVPLTFVLRDSKYRSLLWQYTRSLFYISQLIISTVEPGGKPDKNTNIKEKIFMESLEELEVILATISEMEEEINLNKLLAVDNFLNAKLIKAGINKDKVSEASEEVKEMFKKKGLGENNSMTKMIDSITGKLTSIDLSKGNILQNMFGIAQNVAMEMRGEIENNPDKFQGTLGAITEVFKEAIDNPESGNEVPSELKNMFNTILATPEMGGSANGTEPSQEEIFKSLEGLIQNNGLDRDEFYKSIKGENGQIDISKLEGALTNINQ